MRVSKKSIILLAFAGFLVFVNLTWEPVYIEYWADDHEEMIWEHTYYEVKRGKDGNSYIASYYMPIRTIMIDHRYSWSIDKGVLCFYIDDEGRTAIDAIDHLSTVAINSIAKWVM